MTHSAIARHILNSILSVSLCYYFARGSSGEVLWWVCLSVCLSVCPRAYLRSHMRDLYQFFYACCLWPCLGPPPAGWRNSKRKGQFWGFSSPTTVHC